MPAWVDEVPARPFAAPARPLWRRVLPVAVAAVVAGAIVGGAAWTLKPPPPAPAGRRSHLTPNVWRVLSARGRRSRH